MELKRTIFFLVTGLLTALVVTATALACVVLVKNHRADTKRTFVAQLAFLSSRAEPLVLWDDRVALKRLLHETVHSHDVVEYAFIEREGRPYVHTFETGVPVALIGVPMDLRDEPVIREGKDNEGRRLLDFALRVGDERTLMHLGLSSTAIDRHVIPQVGHTCLLGALAMVTGVGLAVAVTRLITSEVDRMTSDLQAEITERKHVEQERENLIELLKGSNATLGHLNERLIQSNRELQDFAYVASHDLQEPLRKVHAFGERLKAKYADALDDQGHDYIDRMQNAASRMQTLINDLLSFSRIATKAQPFTRVELGKIVEGVLTDLEARIEELGARVEVSDLPTIDADPSQMGQLLQNLIGNALKFHREDEPPIVKVRADFTGDGGQGSAGTQLGQQLCQITVQDNGIGFEQKHAERIFGFFQRLHGRGTYEGTGIGLAICRKIVERHRGNITVESSPGQGARFIVTLPVRQLKGEPEQCQTKDSLSLS